MQLAKVSVCGRFIVLEGLHLDRVAFEEIERWASARRLRPQDAIQVAICAFNERCEPPAKPASSRVLVRPTHSDRIE